jgi:hypothetical protein
MDDLKIICLESDAFYALVKEVVHRIKEENGVTEDKWVTSDEAMRLLNIKSKTTLQKLRDEGRIKFSQPSKKIILYDRDSINEYLEDHSRNTF